MTTVKTKKGREVWIKTFFDCGDTQTTYLERATQMIDALEEQWGDTYKPELHDTQVLELVRSELMAEHYEMLLANNDETELTPMLLKQERIQVGILRSKFLIPLDRVKSNEPDIPEESPPSLMQMAENAFVEELEPEEPESPIDEEEEESE